MEFRLSYIKQFLKKYNIGSWDGTHRDVTTGHKVKTKLSDFYNYPSLYLYIERRGVAEYEYSQIDDTKFRLGSELDFIVKDYTDDWLAYLMQQKVKKASQQINQKEKQKMRKITLNDIKEFLEEEFEVTWNGEMINYADKCKVFATISNFKKNIVSIPVEKDGETQVFRVLATQEFIKVTYPNVDNKTKEAMPTITKIYTSRWKNFVNNQLDQLAFEF